MDSLTHSLTVTVGMYVGVGVGVGVGERQSVGRWQRTGEQSKSPSVSSQSVLSQFVRSCVHALVGYGTAHSLTHSLAHSLSCAMRNE